MENYNLQLQECIIIMEQMNLTLWICAHMEAEQMAERIKIRI